MKYITLLILCLFLSTLNLLSQNYRAIHGSSYAGALGAANNPASIVNVPYSWDITPLALQFESSTNAITVGNYSLLSSPRNSVYYIDNGNFGRYAAANFNLHLFNMRVALNRRQAIAGGMNLKGYVQGNTDTYNFIDTVSTLRSFLKLNEENKILRGAIKGSSWLEIFGTYSQTIWDNEASRLNAGVTVKIMRGIAGAFGNLQNIGFAKSVQGNQTTYLLKNGGADYAYSSNLDNWTSGKTAYQNTKDVLVFSETGLSLDIGIEYLIKSQAINTFYDDDNYFDYEWKVGISLLDIGSNRYNYSAQSRSVGSAKDNVSDKILENKFDAPGIRSFNDSLIGVLNDVQVLAGQFSVINPARLVVNVDRHFFDDFYLNGDLSVNLSSLAGKEKLYVTHLNVLTLTPRWETRRYGLYLPVQLNTQRQFWLGMAFKAGPVLAGVHNLGNVFARNKMHNGGVYLAFTVRPGNLTRSFRDKRNNCPQ